MPPTLSRPLNYNKPDISVSSACQGNSCITGTSTDNKDGGSCRGEEWACRTCYANPCVCGTRR